MKLAVIPARGGSKRIPRKNIRPFCGKPMIAWSIEAAMKSNVFDRIIVSTDDDEIASVAISYGAEVPFRRPEALSDDHTGTIPVIAHATKWQTENDSAPDQVCCIYATAPFLTAQVLSEGLDILIRQNCEYVFPVTSFGFPIQRAVRITEAGRSEMLYPDQFSKRSQDLEEVYHDAGQFYWGLSSAWTQQAAIFSADAVPMILPRYRVQDIDTLDDWRRAELMFEALGKQ